MSVLSAARLAVTSVVLAGGLTAGMAVTSGSAAIAGEPTETGCPAAYDLLSVTWLEANGPYRLPRQLDSQGNQDGYVCGKKTQDQAAENYCGGPCPAQLYNFMENSRTPDH